MSNQLRKYKKAFNDIKELISGIDPYEIACLSNYINKFESSLNDDEPEKEEYTDKERLDFLLFYFYIYDNDNDNDECSEPVVKISKKLKEKLSLHCLTYKEDLREVIDKCLDDNNSIG